jgi:nitrite reductase/ring-hydroxylating ferredoxin subunit/uncharacterized membrane protein
VPGRRFSDIAARALGAVEGQQWLDTPSYKLEHAIALTLNLLGDASEPVRNMLHGLWLGHPLHPALADLPVGAWTTALVLDGADALSLRPARFDAAVEKSIAVGLAGAVGAAVTGLADWQYTHDNARRVGLVHGSMNTVVIGLYAASLWDRRRGRRGRARLLSTLGYGLVQAAAYVGGDQVSRHPIGVDHADRQLEPRTFVSTIDEAELHDDQPQRVDADGVAIVLVRSGGTVHALGEQCSHLGGPLSEGRVYRGSLVCPWHGSRFVLESGRTVSGPATTPQPCFRTRLREGRVEVRRRPPVPTHARQRRRAGAGTRRCWPLRCSSLTTTSSALCCAG